MTCLAIHPGVRSDERKARAEVIEAIGLRVGRHAGEENHCHRNQGNGGAAHSFEYSRPESMRFEFGVVSLVNMRLAHRIILALFCDSAPGQAERFPEKCPRPELSGDSARESVTRRTITAQKVPARCFKSSIVNRRTHYH
jgi:hypothetical protein